MTNDDFIKIKTVECIREALKSESILPEGVTKIMIVRQHIEVMEEALETGRIPDNWKRDERFPWVLDDANRKKLMQVVLHERHNKWITLNGVTGISVIPNSAIQIEFQSGPGDEEYDVELYGIIDVSLED